MGSGGLAMARMAQVEKGTKGQIPTKGQVQINRSRVPTTQSSWSKPSTARGDFEFDHHGFAVLYRFTDSHGAMFGQIRVPGDAFSFIWHRWPLHMHPVMSPITIYSSVGPQPTKHRGWRASGQCSRSSRSRITRVNHLAT